MILVHQVIYTYSDNIVDKVSPAVAGDTPTVAGGTPTVSGNTPTVAEGTSTETSK